MSERIPVESDRQPSTTISRVDRSKREAIEWYDRISPWYDPIVARLDRRPRNRGIRLLDVDAEERVLDVGSGTGRALVAFATDVAPGGHVVGLDISRGMCAVARTTAEEAGVANRVTVVRGDAEVLPLRSNAFDAVFSSFTLELFDTPAIPVVLEEWRRVLRDGGRVGVVALSKRDATVATHAYERLHDLLPQYADCRPIFVRELLDDAGFSVIEVDTVPLWGLTAEVVVARR